MTMPTLHDVHVERPLTNISIAYRNGEYIFDQVFPVVSVQKKSDVYWTFGKSSWFRNEVQLRAPGAEAQEGDYEITTASYNCLTRAIAKTIPDEVRENADAPLAPDAEATAWVTDQLLRAQERRVAAITTGGSGLWAYSASPTVQWTSDTSNPLADIEGAINGVVSSIGRMPTVAVMSWDAWRYLKHHPDVLDRIKYTRPGSQMVPGDLTDWFGFNKVLVGMSLYDPAKEGTSSSTSYIWGDGFWCGYVPGGPALMTPAAGYSLEWMSREVRRYRLDTRHSDKIEAQHSTAEVITASDAGAVLFNVV